MTLSEARVSIIVSGRMQGVFYRASAREAAMELGIKGWVRNTRDGRVEATAEGPREKLDEFVKWCKRGPQFARVDNIDVKWEEPTGEFANFRTLY